MKFPAFLAAGAALMVLGWMASAQDFTVTIDVDENGHGTFTNSDEFFATLSSSMQADPGPGGLASALTYNLLNPPGLTAGDLLLIEPGAERISDIIRFNPQEDGGSLVFYSDNDEGTDALADTGFPTDQYDNTLIMEEVGLEGNNGFTYTPMEGQPGFVAGADGPVTYILHSDSPAVPEPGSLALLMGIGVSGAGFAVRRLRRT